MIYLTNDVYDQAVYCELHPQKSRRLAGGIERRFTGLLGNGVSEVPVTVRSWRDCVEVVFGAGDMLFACVDEHIVRRLLGDVVRELAAA